MANSIQAELITHCWKWNFGNKIALTLQATHFAIGYIVCNASIKIKIKIIRCALPVEKCDKRRKQLSSYDGKTFKNTFSLLTFKLWNGNFCLPQNKWLSTQHVGNAQGNGNYKLSLFSLEEFKTL